MRHTLLAWKKSNARVPVERTSGGFSALVSRQQPLRFSSVFADILKPCASGRSRTAATAEPYASVDEQCDSTVYLPAGLPLWEDVRLRWAYSPHATRSLQSNMTLQSLSGRHLPVLRRYTLSSGYALQANNCIATETTS